MSELINWESKEINAVIKQTVAAGTTAAEFEMFKQMCLATGLNPFKREIWCIVTGEGQWRKVQMMAGINGFVSIANSHPQFDGMEIVEGKTQQIKAGEAIIEAPIEVTAKVYRKDRKFPSVFTAKWAEYAQPLVTQKGKLSIWAQKPSVMLAKCAKSMALREAFPQEMNGLYTEEEMPSSFAAPVARLENASSEPEIVAQISQPDDFNEPMVNSEPETWYRFSTVGFKDKDAFKSQAVEAGGKVKFADKAWFATVKTVGYFLCDEDLEAINNSESQQEIIDVSNL